MPEDNPSSGANIAVHDLSHIPFASDYPYLPDALVDRMIRGPEAWMPFESPFVR